MGTAATILLSEGKCTFDLRSNYKMGLKLARTSLWGTTERAGVLVMTLNKSKSDPKIIIGLLIRLA